MQTEPDSIRRLVETLTGEALKQFLRNLRHHVELQRRVMRGELRQDQVNAAYVRYAIREGSAYRDEVGRLTAQYYRDLVDVGSRYSDRFYDELLADAPPQATGSESDGGERVSLELHGRPGHEVVRRVALENSDATEAEVTFELGECRGPDGIPFTAPLAVQPARLTIPPGGRADVTLRLALLPSLFAPGNVYSLEIGVHGQEELSLDVVIWAEEDVEVAPAAPRPDAEAANEATETRYAVRCPRCGRTFARGRPGERLRPHKAPGGAPCPERAGVPVDPAGPKERGIVTVLGDERWRKRDAPRAAERHDRRDDAASS